MSNLLVMKPAAVLAAALLVLCALPVHASVLPEDRKVKTFRAFSKYEFARWFPKFRQRIEKCSDFESPPHYTMFRFVFKDGVFTAEPQIEDYSCSFIKNGMSLQEASVVAHLLTAGREAGLKPFTASHLKWGEQDPQTGSGWSVSATSAPDASINKVEYFYGGN